MKLPTHTTLNGATGFDTLLEPHTLYQEPRERRGKKRSAHSHALNHDIGIDTLLKP